jgi:purine-binding chemotaxis protein CheW
MTAQSAAATAPVQEPGMPAGERPRREFLTCRLGAESYGIDILRVQEIREFDRLTRVPRVARFVRGVINLRGAIVPIIDLGLMFGFPEPIALEQASVIVLNEDHRLVGLAVTAVSDVIALAEDEIMPAPDLGQRAIDAAISGIGAGDGSSVLLLDVDHVLGRIRGGVE